ncbi:hypothetical protein ACFWXK_22615 [Streptomyces sp. NPDC059070]|uniref:hypothetical protein n=1 Tax=Streptomyces sp. NPDC059070 TaxID=3346713 RepID=UPI0036C6300F
MTMSYTEAASAEGAWTRSLRVPAAPVDEVRRALAELASPWPVSAFLPGQAAEAVAEVVLYRDPSRTYGTPDPASCVLIGLGLREGYNAAAATHAPQEVTDRLRAASPYGWSCPTARLVSARLVDHTVRWYEETGVLVHAQERLATALEAAALSCTQDRYVVTDLTRRRTYALRLRGGGGPPR